MLKLRDWIKYNDYGDYENYNNYTVCDWYALCRNPNVIDIILKYFDKINLNGLSYNENVIDILKKNQNKIIWSNLSTNSGASK